jgi:membrane-associated protease RseP (regulator of RpoE activity)
VNPDGKVLPLELILDLGATHPVSLSANKNPAIVIPAGAIRTRTGRGMSGAMTGRVGRIAGFEFGGHRLTQVVATFPDTAYADPRGLDQKNGNLGSGILGRFNVALDLGGSRMYVTPNSRFKDPFEWDMSGLVFDMGEGGRVTVAQVLAGSPAAEAKIAPGAELVAVDGAPVEPREMLKQRQRFRQPGREVSLTLRENGQDRVVKLRLRRLV